VGGADAGGVLEHVEVGVEVAELGPGGTFAIAFELDRAAVAFGEKIGHQVVEVARGDAFSRFYPAVYLALEAGEGRHDEEVPVEVFHRFLYERYLELRIFRRARRGSWPG